jgi:predicted phosphoribosyltransferase
MGDVLVKMANVEEALKVFAKQLVLSKQLKNKKLEAVAFGALGVGHRLAKQFDKSLGFHTQVRAPEYCIVEAV